MTIDNVLSKDEFIEIIGSVVKSHDVSRLLSDTIRKSAKETDGDMLVDFFDPFVLYSGQLNHLVKTLEVMFRDDNGWISWWLFDCDYGHDERLLGTAYEPEGESIPMATIGDLYDRLVADLMGRREEAGENG